MDYEDFSEEDGVVTRGELKGIVKLVLGFLDGEHMGHLDYIEEKQQNFAFPLDKEYKYFLEIDPRTLDGSQTSTSLRCILDEKVMSKEGEDFYDKLRNSFIYAILDDSLFGSLMIVKCESLIREYSYVGNDGYGNLIQKRVLGTENNSKHDGTRFIRAVRTQRLRKELGHLLKKL